MRKDVWYLAALALLAAAFWVAALQCSNRYLTKGALTFTLLSFTYLLTRIALSEVVKRRIRDAKVRYKLNKTLSIVHIFIVAVVLLTVWVEDPSTLLVAYGLIGAGIAIALQDVFRNFMGGVMILANGLFSVGDRIQIDKTYGDVIDIDIFYTTLLEIRGWVDGDQASGRLVIVPNQRVLSDTLQNYNRDHGFIWDEIMIPLTYDSDWRKASAAFLEMAKTKTKDFSAQAEKDIERIGEKYYLPKRDVESALYVTPTDNWIELAVRYVAPVKGRRVLRNDLMKQMLEWVEETPGCTVASATYEITVKNK